MGVFHKVINYFIIIIIIIIIFLIQASSINDTRKKVGK
jgi:hypothetical protein